MLRKVALQARAVEACLALTLKPSPTLGTQPHPSRDAAGSGGRKAGCWCLGAGGGSGEGGRYTAEELWALVDQVCNHSPNHTATHNLGSKRFGICANGVDARKFTAIFARGQVVPVLEVVGSRRAAAAAGSVWQAAADGGDNVALCLGERRPLAELPTDGGAVEMTCTAGGARPAAPAAGAPTADPAAAAGSGGGGEESPGAGPPSSSSSSSAAGGPAGCTRSVGSVKVSYLQEQLARLVNAVTTPPLPQHIYVVHSSPPSSPLSGRSSPEACWRR